MFLDFLIEKKPLKIGIQGNNPHIRHLKTSIKNKFEILKS